MGLREAQRCQDLTTSPLKGLLYAGQLSDMGTAELGEAPTSGAPDFELETLALLGLFWIQPCFYLPAVRFNISPNPDPLLDT